uniref:Uncharacterized protein n=1 Tax=Arundo donax TaxID=35708 RepID=A0A0A9GGU2_ARUDO
MCFCATAQMTRSSNSAVQEDQIDS